MQGLFQFKEFRGYFSLDRELSMGDLKKKGRPKRERNTFPSDLLTW
jgi:hypothetical protein